MFNEILLLYTSYGIWLTSASDTVAQSKIIMVPATSVPDPGSWELGVFFDNTANKIATGKLAWSKENVSWNRVVFPHLFTSAEISILDSWRQERDRFLVDASVTMKLQSAGIEVSGSIHYEKKSHNTERSSSISLRYTFLQQFEMLSGNLMVSGISQLGRDIWESSGKKYTHICSGIVRGGSLDYTMTYTNKENSDTVDFGGQLSFKMPMGPMNIGGNVSAKVTEEKEKRGRKANVKTTNTLGVDTPDNMEDMMKSYTDLTQQISKNMKTLPIKQVWLTPIDLYLDWKTNYIADLKTKILNKILEITTSLDSSLETIDFLLSLEMSKKILVFKNRILDTKAAFEMYRFGIRIRFENMLNMFRYSDVTVELSELVNFHERNAFKKGLDTYMNRLQSEVEALAAISQMFMGFRNFNISENPERDREDKTFTIFFVFLDLVEYDRFIKLMQVTAKFIESDKDEFPEFRFKAANKRDNVLSNEVTDISGSIQENDIPSHSNAKDNKKRHSPGAIPNMLFDSKAHIYNSQAGIVTKIFPDDIINNWTNKHFNDIPHAIFSNKSRLSLFMGGDIDPRRKEEMSLFSHWKSYNIHEGQKQMETDMEDVSNGYTKLSIESNKDSTTIYYEEIEDEINREQREDNFIDLLGYGSSQLQRNKRELSSWTYEINRNKDNTNVKKNRYKRVSGGAGQVFIPQPWFLDDTILAGIVKNYLLLREFLKANEKIDTLSVVMAAKNSFHHSIQNMLSKYEDSGSVLILSERYHFTRFDWEVPSTPGIPQLVSADYDTITITWQKPTSGIKNIDAYSVHYRWINITDDGEEEKEWKYVTVDGQFLQATLNELQILGKYEVQVDCILKKSHPSIPTTKCPMSQKSTMFTLGSSRPTNVKIDTNLFRLGRYRSVGYTHVFLTWDPPKHVHRDILVKGYRINYISSDNLDNGCLTICDTKNFHKVNGLKTGTAYSFSVIAIYDDKDGNSAASTKTEWITTLKQDRYCISKGELALPTNKWETYGWWIPPSNNDQCFGNFLIPKVPVSDLLDTPQVTAQQSVNDCLSRDSAHILQLSSTEERDLIMEKYGDFFLLGLKQVRSTSFIVKVGRINISTNSVSDQITIDDQTTEEDLEGQSLWTWMDSGEIMDGLEIEKNLITHEKSYSVIKRIKVEELKDIDNEDKIPQGDENVIDSEDSNCIVATRFGWIKIGCHYIHHNFICGNKALPCEEEEDDDADMDDEEDEEQEQDTHSQDANISIAEQEYDENEDYEY